ncbi:ferrous iron efflux protein F [Klebsiella pneumoniae]|uniref:Ferrous iron efflux protein F n=1 Tax=Klebsiella pneumoniae TaxID=573 RepID=A0A2X3CUV4_KLEPN|nr:ferrous iron efflux protein F [Klebsiella pneumoniae]
MKNIPLVMAKRSRWAALAALAQSMFISGSALFLFLTGIQHLVRPEPLQAAGVGVVVTLIAPR